MNHVVTLFVLAALAAPATAQSLRFTKLPTTGLAPDGRIDGVIAYDSTGGNLYLFGGSIVTATNDLWAYSLDRREWRQISVSNPPPARFGHTMIFDPVRRRLIVFGGQASGFFSDVWAYDIAANRWALLAPDNRGPSKRYGHSGIYDAARDRLVISHGFTDTGRFDDTWAFDLASATWRDISPNTGTRPLRRCLHHAVVDAPTDTMYLYGGCASGTPIPNNCPLGDLWAFNLRTNTWTERTSSPMPPARQWYGFGFDEGRKRVVVFGGSGRGALNDTWEYDPSSNRWAEVALSGDRPTARSRHEATYVPQLSGVVFFGGSAGVQHSNELLLLSPEPPASSTPAISSGGVTGVFSGAAKSLAPGKIVSIYGQNLGPATGVSGAFNADAKLPTSLAETAVTIGGIAAPIFYAQAGQLNVQVPYEIAGMTEADIVVRYQSAASQSVRLPVAPTSPDLFPSALHADGRLVSADAPASPGEVLLFFATGQGITSPASLTGGRANAPYPEPGADTRLLIGGRVVPLAFKGQAPGTSGVIQLNAQLPSDLAPGTAVPVVLEIGGQRSQEGVTLVVR